MFNRRNKLTKKLQKGQLKGGSLISFSSPKSIVAEQFRSIRTNIEFSQLDKNIKSLLVSSSIPAEGKSTVSANLAYVMGQNEKRVLIVDADLRKPNVHRTFKMNNEVGLTTLLANSHLDYRLIIQESRELGLYLLPSGPIPPNPSELLNSERMTRLMKELQQDFDYIIYDAPPINAVTDPQILSAKVDGVILVVREGYSRKEEVRTAKKILDKAKANIIGYVLNSRMASEFSGYYGYKEE
ncbi:polysaccharide biosynthesis tyrosine autokinase [Aerococcaceae bacterium DSM 109653]|uniref:Tyrosine-protein kinase CpsD n=1 Tax=Fundicoccus ignavus TaxID=2664442 RepID=A0A844BRT2_9LACT|nr:CpsD/CapB family tyrosine-protein kinase [Fundicoccus ignavus]MRI80792.1 polysaccharide biosynthesis tyrosine autokinase [Fundicoccus ignavus]